MVTATTMQTVVRRVAALMIAEAATLAVASALHLSGNVTGRAKLFDSDDAGIAEAIIGAVLLGGVIAIFRLPRWGRTIGLAATGFATAGFIVGLSITARGGHWPDIAYHMAVLPALIGSLVALVYARNRP